MWAELAAGLAPPVQDNPPDSVLAWATRHRMLEGRPFSLDRFLPLLDIYNDPHPDIVVIKPAQRGVSEWLVNYASYALEHGAQAWAPDLKDALNVGYIFPTKVALEDFSKERISGLVEETAYLQALWDDGDNFNGVTFKQVSSSSGGKSHLYLRGGWSTKALKSFPADLVLLDEYDEMAAGAPALAWRRTNASPCRRRARVSTPTLPEAGIHDLYLQSDQRVYRQRHACGAMVGYDFWRDVWVDGKTYGGPGGWQYMRPQAIRAGAVTLHCPACGAAVSGAERMAPGVWQAQASAITSLRGYWVPWWPFPVVDLVEYACTAVSHDPSEVTELYRSDLGLPYEAKGTRITPAMLQALSAGLPGGRLPDAMVRRTPTMGVDVGTWLHYRISDVWDDGRRVVLAMGAVATWPELDGLMAAHGIRLAVVDALPEGHAVRDFAARHPGRVAMASYPSNATALRARLYAPEAAQALSDGRVQVNRTMAMDGVYAAIAGAAEHWPADIHNDPEVVAHMVAPSRKVANDATGQPVATWVHTKPDHLYHACVYDYIAAQLAPHMDTGTGGILTIGATDSRYAAVGVF